MSDDEPDHGLHVVDVPRLHRYDDASLVFCHYCGAKGERTSKVPPGGVVICPLCIRARTWADADALLEAQPSEVGDDAGWRRGG